MSEEVIEQIEEAPKSKEETRNVEHSYVDNNGWCRECGRSEGWQAHPVKEDEEAAPKKAQTPVVVEVEPPPSRASQYNTGELESGQSEDHEESE